MVLDLFKNISDNGEIIVIESGTPLREQLKGLDWSQLVILANGRKVSPDYEPKADDYLVIRRIPGSSVATVFAVIAIVVAAVAGVAAGINAYKMRKQQAKLKEMQEALSARDDVSNIPWLQGASNSIATGKTQPYIIGKHLFTPYLLQQGFYAISGTDGINEDYYTVLEGGFASQAIQRISADDSIIHDFGNVTTPQTGMTRPTGGIWKYRSGINDNRIQIGQAGSSMSLSQFTQKRTVDTPNVQLPWRETCEQWTATKTEEYTERVWVEVGDDRGYYRNVKRTRTVTYTEGAITTETKKFILDRHAMDVEICIMFNGLCKYSDKGKKQAHTRHIGFRYSTNGGSSWSAMTVTGSGPNSITTADGYCVATFTRTTTSQIRFALSHTFTASQGWNAGQNDQPIIVEVTNRDTQYTGTSGAYEDCYVQWIQSRIYDPENSSSSSLTPCKIIEDRENNVSTIIGLKLRASAENETKLGKINIITSGVARTWNAATSQWSTTKTATSNPAAWILEILTSATHPASQYTDAEIDLASLGALYEYCTQQGFEINMVLTGGQPKEQVLETICNTCRCMLYRNIYGQISAAIDREKENAVALLNAQNITSIEITKSMARPVDGLKLAWVNAEAGYVQDEYVCMRSGVTRTADSIIREMDVQGITDYDHLVKYARYIMAGAVLRPKTIKVTTGLEGQYYTPLSKILMQDDSLRVGLGNAVIKQVLTYNDNIIGLQLQEPVDLDTSHDFGVIMECVSDTYCTPLAKAINQGGRTSEIQFETPFPISSAVIPHAGDVLSYGYIEDGQFDRITSEYLITAIEPNNGSVTLSLIDYNPDVYTTGPYGQYIPNITQKPTAYEPVIIPPPETSAEVEDVLNGDNIAPPDTPTGVTAVATERGIEVSCAPPDTSTLNNSIAQVIWEYAPEGIQPESVTTDPVFYPIEAQTGYTATITWPTGTYPERSDLASWLIRVKFVSIYSKESEYSTYTTVNTDTYGTWQVQSPIIVLRTNKRSLHAHLEQPPAANVYGNVRYRVQISRHDDTEGETRLWYEPNLSADPYGAETNYKGTLDGYVIATSDFSITVPLEGQAAEPPNPTDTLYYLRFTPYNEAGAGTPVVSDQMTARATSARDVVLAHTGTGDMNTGALTAENIYTENLAAIVGMFAQIRDGIETADNFWDMENSEFRVGNDHGLEGDTISQDDPSAQYIHFKDGNLKMHIQQLIADISQSYVRGIFDIYSSDQLYRCRVSEQGLTLQSRASLTAEWETKGVFTLNPANGSLMITNTAPSSDYTIAKPTGANVYHFQESAGNPPLDDGGTNGEGLTFSSYSYAETSPILSDQAQYYQGTITKTGLVTKSAAIYGTPAYCAADNITYESAYGYYASRIGYSTNIKTVHIYIKNTLTGAVTGRNIVIPDAEFTSFSMHHTFWYNGQCYFGVVINRSAAPAQKLYIYNSSGTKIWEDGRSITAWNYTGGAVHTYNIAAGQTSFVRNTYYIYSGSESKNNTITMPAAIYTFCVPFATPSFFVSTTNGQNVYMYSATGERRYNYGGLGQNPDMSTYLADRIVSLVKRTSSYYFGGSSNALSFLAELDTTNYSYVYNNAISALYTGTELWAIRKSDGQLGKWDWFYGGFTAIEGTTNYNGSHRWCITDDMLFDLSNGAAYRLIVYNQTSTATKNYAFWYNGSSVRLGAFTLTTPAEWCYITIALASGTITWHIYKTDGTSTTGTYSLATYTDSDTADNTGFILNGSVEEFSYGALPSNPALMIEYKVPYGNTTNLPISDQFIIEANDLTKAGGNVLNPPENNLTGTASTGIIEWYNTNQVVASGAVVTLGSGDKPGRKVNFTTLGPCSIQYTAITNSPVTDTVNGYLALEYTWTGSAWFCSSAPPIGRVVNQMPDEDTPGALYGGQWERWSYGGAFPRYTSGQTYAQFVAKLPGSFTDYTTFVATENLPTGMAVGSDVCWNGYYRKISAISGRTITIGSPLDDFAKTNATFLQLLMPEKLPNIKAIFSLGANGINSGVVGFCGGSGAVHSYDAGSGATVQAKSTATTPYRSWEFNASWSNAVYGDSNPVQPLSVVIQGWRRIS